MDINLVAANLLTLLVDFEGFHMNELNHLVRLSLVIGTMSLGAAHGQDAFERDNGLNQNLETRAMVRLHMPFGNYSRQPEDSGPKLSLDLGIDQSEDWRSPLGYTSYDNVLQLGLNFQGKGRLTVGGIDYADHRREQLDISGGGATALWIAGGLVLTAGSVALTVLAVDRTVDQIESINE